jgi:hypothetical protein
MSIQEKNKQLMKTQDDAWNLQDWNTFKERHADNVVAFWPGQADRQEEYMTIMKNP